LVRSSLRADCATFPHIPLPLSRTSQRDATLHAKAR
jgi:hypothetical protein